jgi:hypothetical protein
MRLLIAGRDALAAAAGAQQLETTDFFARGKRNQ